MESGNLGNSSVAEKPIYITSSWISKMVSKSRSQTKDVWSDSCYFFGRSALSLDFALLCVIWNICLIQDCYYVDFFLSQIEIL